MSDQRAAAGTVLPRGRLLRADGAFGLLRRSHTFGALDARLGFCMYDQL